MLVPTVLGIVTIAFLIVRLVPGDPAAVILGDYATAEPLASLRERLRLNEPIPLQYVAFLGDMLRGNLGITLVSRQPVINEILVQLPATVLLALSSIVVGTFVGLPLGILAAVKRGTGVDQAAM